MGERQSVDWERIEQTYREGDLSIREIARSGGCTDTAIRKRAKRDGWTRDLSSKITVRARALAVEALVRGPGSREGAPANQLDEATIVAAPAAGKASVLVRQQEAISDIGRIVDALRREMARVGADPELFERLADLVAVDMLGIPGDEAEAARRRNLRIAAFERLLALPSRLRMLKDVLAMEATRVDLESKVFHLGDAGLAASVPSGLSTFYPEVEPGHPAYIDPATPHHAKPGTFWGVDAAGVRHDFH